MKCLTGKFEIKVTEKCRFCERDFEGVEVSGKLVFPYHKEVGTPLFACRGAGMPFQSAIQPPPIVPPKETAKSNDDIQQRFEIYHRENPAIYQWLKKFALEAKAAGFKKFAVRPIVERARWYVAIETRSAGDFKINNDYCSRYSRLLMEQEPELKDFFETRVLRGNPHSDD